MNQGKEVVRMLRNTIHQVMEYSGITENKYELDAKEKKPRIHGVLMSPATNPGTKSKERE